MSEIQNGTFCWYDEVGKSKQLVKVCGTVKLIDYSENKYIVEVMDKGFPTAEYPYTHIVVSEMYLHPLTNKKEEDPENELIAKRLGIQKKGR